MRIREEDGKHSPEFHSDQNNNQEGTKVCENYFYISPTKGHFFIEKPRPLKT